jgi:hypothetical protein
MAGYPRYVGRDLEVISNIENLDTITFDGSSSYSLTKNSVSYIPTSANNILVSIDGVVQSDNFTVSGSTIDFGVAIPGTSTCDFIKHFGTGVAFTPADGTVGTSQIADASITSAKLASGVALGKVLQVVQATDETARSTTSGTYVTASNTLLVNITPSSTSSKILIMVNTSAYHSATSSTMNGAIFKNGSILKTITYGFKRDDDSAVISGVYLDSPATSNTLGTITAMEIAG